MGKKVSPHDLLSDTTGCISIRLWEQEDNKSTYYEHKLDMQGTISGHSMKEAEEAFEKKYGVKL